MHKDLQNPLREIAKYRLKYYVIISGVTGFSPKSEPGFLFASGSSQNDHLLLTHVPHRERDSAGAVSRLPASRERHPVGAEGRRVVDHDGRGVEAFGGVEGRADVLREDARLEGDGQGIGNGDGLVQITVRVDAGDRSEDLIGRDFRARR